MPYIFQQIQDKAIKQGIGQQDVADAREWFRDEARKINAANPTRFMNDPSFKKENRLNLQSIGKMYMFVYDPKTKDILPYYDTFPLVFPIEFYGDSFLGINMHYLPPALRAKLMDALYLTINNNKYDKTTLLKISYNILNGASRYRYFKPCVKKYLMTHVGSPFIYIAPDEWDYALMLPTERFQKANKSVVYKDSLSMV